MAIELTDRREIDGSQDRGSDKVCLVIPPSPFLADERVFPSLGILKVAAVLRDAGVPVDVLDFAGVPDHLERWLPDYLKDKDTTVFGITSTTPQLPSAVRILESIKRERPSARVIIGGPHATMAHTAFMQDKMHKTEGRGTRAFNQLTGLFDTVVVGDGEKAIFEAIRPEAPKVVDAGSLASPLFLRRGELENFPFPARDLIDIDMYDYKIDGLPAHSLIAQLGCPFKCGFCGGRDSQVFRVARTRPTESIIDEVRQVYRDYGRPGIMFYDDELNINHEKLMGLLEGLIRLQEQENVEMRFRGFVKAELFNAEQAQMMNRAGFRVILSGVESGSDEMLTTMQKNTSRKVNSDWIAYCHEAGLRGKALMSIGHPGESEKTIRESEEWVKSNLRPGWDDVDWTIITEYPGSPYFDRSVPFDESAGIWVYTEPKTGNRLYSQDVNFAEKAEYYKGVPGDYTSYVWTDHLSPDQLVELRNQVELSTRVDHLKLSSIQKVAERQFEHSMGQNHNRLPSTILRSSTI